MTVLCMSFAVWLLIGCAVKGKGIRNKAALIKVLAKSLIAANDCNWGDSFVGLLIEVASSFIID